MILFLCFLLGVFAQQTKVQTAYGTVQGSQNNGVLSWKGIPYAQPPVGALRWENPKNPVPWKDVKVTTSFAPGCPQNCDLPPHTCPEAQSEDCLYMNIYSPVNTTGALPVMVFLHGGHFDQGSGGCDLYDATTMVQTGQLVIVTFSYRLGVLGWMANYDGLTGNYGFRDQLLALEWVQQNIKGFGGDPSAVTLFGQSAGGTSLRAHLVSPKSSGLFHRAISQSDPVSLPTQDLVDAQNWGVKFLKDINCQTTACLRTKNLTSLLAAQKIAEKHINIAKPLEVFLPFTPLVDGVLIPHHIFDAIELGKLNKVPMIFGTTYQDALLFVYKAMQAKLTTAEYLVIVGAIFLGKTPSVLDQYPPKLVGDKRPEMSVLGTDYIFTCPVRSLFAHFENATKGQYPLYLYQWNHALSWDGWGPEYPFCENVVCHGAELPYVWNPPVIKKFVNLTQDEEVLSTQMIRYWTNFAKSGNPNKPLPVTVQWPEWSASSLKNIDFQTPQSVITTGLSAPKCDFWDSIGYHWGW